jgi:hypothetical protein
MEKNKDYDEILNVTNTLTLHIWHLHIPSMLDKILIKNCKTIHSEQYDTGIKVQLTKEPNRR